MSIQSYYNRKIANIIVSYAEGPAFSEKEIASVFDACDSPNGNFEIGRTFECPLSLQYFEDALLTSCGHTFEAPYLYASLASSPGCPLDRSPIVRLRSNRLVTELTQKIKGHLKAKEGLTKTSFHLTYLGEEVPEGSINQFNEAIVAENIKKFKSFDMRHQLDEEIIKAMRAFYRCPIGKNLLKDPVVSLCGHTFERANVKRGSKCPIDQSKISDLIPNYLVKGQLEMLRKVDLNYGFEIVSSGKGKIAGFIFYKYLSVHNLSGFLREIGLAKKDERRLLAYPKQTTFFGARRAYPQVDGSPCLSVMHFLNDITPQQYLESVDQKMGED